MRERQAERSAPLRIGIAGAGLLGRLLAWTLAQAGHQVSVFDPAPGPNPGFNGQGAAGFSAAGMLSPLAELETTDPDVAERGWYSIARWLALSHALQARPDETPLCVQRGSLMVAHSADVGAAQRVLQRLSGVQHRHHGQAGAELRQPERISPAQLQALEPCLHSSSGPLHAWRLHDEAHIDTVLMLQRLLDTALDVTWHWASTVERIEPHRMAVSNCCAHHLQDYDWVLDVRGVGARPATAVRGVRGELVWLQAPGLGLQRPVRLMHPRHRVYIVPRSADVVLVGASEIESEDRSPVSLRSAVELMAAAQSVIPGLAEARILRLDRNLRPALPDHRPEIHVEPGLIRLNGLYRHGWLLAPSLVDEALARAGLCAAPLSAAAPQHPLRS
ncbi:FAD-dependent oxidoreductase [Ideonella sp.]|jgi:glycine oxidase|uniref:FAD-dependent oxidoreductase n=1 Tax=Ideonella sp. TaxID=1929293 RepID=UPI0037BFD7F4